MFPKDIPLPAGFRQRFPWFGGDLQTLKAFLDPRRPDLSAWPGRRLWLDLDDGSGDRLAATLQGESPAKDSALVLLLHGLTGCEESAYVMESAAAHLAAGRRVLRLNLRGAGPSRPACREAYHAGRSEDLFLALEALERLEPGLLRGGFFLQGYSLGANMLLKFLSEWGGTKGRGSAGFPLLGALAVSAPIDLADAQRRLLAGRNRLYHGYLLARMKEEALAAPGLTQAEKILIRRVRDIREFDDRITAPRNGFLDAEDYYARNSARQFLADIAVPTLLIHARNDPWIPEGPFDRYDWSRAPWVRPLLPVSGGHVGFHNRGSGRRWHDDCALAFLAALAGN